MGTIIEFVSSRLVGMQGQAFDATAWFEYSLHLRPRIGHLVFEQAMYRVLRFTKIVFCGLSRSFSKSYLQRATGQ